ncbi:preprotein translocase subunit SecG [Zhouia spongiae]|uniref:Protein-export membrane protein SecG n=1 Tax=Zhouia spongiae TaxID=2202721 RepID=A0ABY3YS33_9FLAO|nr:preprotein translocase subunit SecG [Zhouia spongiae]UNZ00469.1 preprotein translocase subunit SecG [Zhouia spongiae]
MMTFSIFLVLIIIVAFLLVLVIMVQNPKGGGLSSTFGGNTQVVGGVKKTGDFLDKSTWTLATILIALILLSNLSLKSGPNSGSKLLEGQEIEAPAQDNTPVEAETPASSTTTDTIAQ